MLWSALLALSLAAAAPERAAERHAIVSKDPAVRIEVPKEAVYIGADRWTLYGVADCEIHLFAEADKAKRIRRLYIVQFEGYIPERPQLRHKPSTLPTATLGTRSFNIRPRAGRTGDPMKPGSEVEHVAALLAKAGYSQPAEIANVSFLWLDEPELRREVLLFYVEDLALNGVKLDDLFSADGPTPKWQPYADALLKRAQQRIRVTP